MDSIKKKRKSTASTKAIVLAISLVLLLNVTAMGTLMFLVDKTAEVKNTFSPAKVTCEVAEDFDGTVKKNVNVQNMSDIKAYVRVKLVTYRVNDDGKKIGGTAAIQPFNPGNGWFEEDGFYYYSKPVAPGQEPGNDLIGASGIELENYNDADGGKQVIEVVAEAIQSVPTSVVTEKWNVQLDNDGVTIKAN